MSTVLATNTSSSNPSRTYDIIEGNDGTIYCTCPGWKFNRTCKHLKGYGMRIGNTTILKPTPEPTDVDFLERLKGVYNE